MESRIRVTVWYENRDQIGSVATLYPEGIHGTIAEGIQSLGGFATRTATLDQPEHGLSDEVLNNTDVLLWWGHRAHDEVSDAVVERVRQRVLAGMGLIVLHSGHFSKIFRRLMGTNCSLRWREISERERIWNVAPDHEITQGIGEFIELPHTEMYGERFDIPEPDRLIFISWYQGGDVFRSGCTWQRGNGRVFYFSPGHETLPIYHDKQIIRVIANAARWAKPRIRVSTEDCPNVKSPLEKIT
jgi:trehalose utilization protein